MSQKFTLVTGASSDIGIETIKPLLQKEEFVWGIYKSDSKNVIIILYEESEYIRLRSQFG